MAWGKTPSPWTAERDERLIALHADGLTGSAIAEQFGGGLSRNAVIARLNRLRVNGNAQVGAARPNPIAEAQGRRAADADRLADAFADGADTIGDAAIAAGLTYERACTLWARIKADLGWQAR